MISTKEKAVKTHKEATPGLHRHPGTTKQQKYLIGTSP
jgi:hypothetical protein